MPTKNFLIVRDGEDAGGLRGAVVAIGNFDGVHRGHRAVIATALNRARSLAKPAAALTFEPHPRAFFNPQEKLFRLTDEATKLRLLSRTGLDGAIVLTFDAALAKLTAEEFVQRILVERFAVSGAVIGFNFYFGTRRTGSPDFLAAEGKKCGFAVDVVPPFEDNGRPISSGPIREALIAGKVEEAAEFLGYPWFVTGRSRAWRQARPRTRLSDRQSGARCLVRIAPWHLCGPHWRRRAALRRRRELRPPADV